MLQAAFAAELPASRAAGNPQAVVTLASELELGARLASRLGAKGLPKLLPGADLGPLLAERARAHLAWDRIEEALRTCSALAQREGLLLVPLKFAAQQVRGESAPGLRSAGDLDLLVPENQLEAWLSALPKAGWEPVRKSRESHEAGVFLHPLSGPLDLHRNLPGVGLNGKPYLTFENLRSAGLLEAPPAPWPACLKLPARAVTLAHSLVHGFCQHQGAFHRYAPFRFLADAVDISRWSTTEDWRLARELTSPSLSGIDFDALWELLSTLTAGQLPEAESHAGLWLQHLVAGAFDTDYQQRLLRESLLTLPPGAQPLRFFWLRLWRAFWPDRARLEAELRSDSGSLSRTRRRLRHWRLLVLKLLGSPPGGNSGS